jgi:hypothetical protein
MCDRRRRRRRRRRRKRIEGSDVGCVSFVALLADQVVERREKMRVELQSKLMGEEGDDNTHPSIDCSTCHNPAQGTVCWA